jgi:hypothetical protein
MLAVVIPVEPCAHGRVAGARAALSLVVAGCGLATRATAPAASQPLAIAPRRSPCPTVAATPCFLALLLPSLLRFVAQPWALLFTLPRSADVLAHRYARVGVFPPLLPARHLAINGAMATPAALPPPVCVRPAMSRQGFGQAKPGPIPFPSLLCYPGQLSRAINLTWRGHFYSTQRALGSAI